MALPPGAEHAGRLSGGGSVGWPGSEGCWGSGSLAVRVHVLCVFSVTRLFQFMCPLYI